MDAALLKARSASDVRKLRERFGVPALRKWRDRKGGSLLHVLAERGGSAEAARLVLAFTEVDGRRKSDLNTALHLAGFSKNPEVAKALLAAGADGSILNKYGETAVPGASLYERSMVVLGTDAFGDGGDGCVLVVDQAVLDSLAYQETPVTCGTASVTTAARYLEGVEMPQSKVLRGMGLTAEKGLSYNDFPAAARRFASREKYPWAIAVRRGGEDPAPFTATLTQDLLKHFPPGGNDARERASILLANYLRVVRGKMSGHWSPLAGARWRETADGYAPTHVLIADTQKTLFPPHWLPLDQFVAQCSSLVTRSASYRGYVVVARDASALAEVASAAVAGGAVAGGAPPPATFSPERALLLTLMLALVILLVCLLAWLGVCPRTPRSKIEAGLGCSSPDDVRRGSRAPQGWQGQHGSAAS